MTVSELNGKNCAMVEIGDKKAIIYFELFTIAPNHIGNPTNETSLISGKQTCICRYYTILEITKPYFICDKDGPMTHDYYEMKKRHATL